MDRDYVVRKRVQNRTIVRELDRDRQRDLLRTGLFFCVFLVVMLFATWQHFEARRLELQQADLQRSRARALEIRRHLRLEAAALTSPVRIASIAREQLHMIAPTRETSTVIERVTTTPPPAPSVVAAR